MTDQQLDDAIKEISTNLLPENVFPEEDLISWAQRKKRPIDIFSIRDLKEDIAELKMEAHL